MSAARRIVATGGEGSAVLKELTARFEAADAFSETPQPSLEEPTDCQNVLFVGQGMDLGENELVTAAAERGIPIVLERPNPIDMSTLSGAGVEADYAIVTVGVGRSAHVQVFDELPAGEDEDDDAEMDLETGATQVQAPGTPSEPEKPLSAPEMADQIARALLDLGTVDERLRGIAVEGEVPENRQFATALDFGWKSRTLDDPSGEQSITQRPRFRISVNVGLSAVDQPLRKKVVVCAVRGVGFEPGELIRNDNKHRGFAQGETYVEISPGGDANFGYVEDYLPTNQADVETVTSGYTWGLSGGMSGGKPSVTFNFSASQSASKSSLNFRTLTRTVGENGMRFHHNVHIVGGDTEINMLRWSDEWTRMFYRFAAFDRRVRSWPRLARQLLPPNSETIFYAPDTETRMGRLVLTAYQRLHYCYTKGGTAYASRRGHQNQRTIALRFSSVDYRDQSA